MFSVLRNISNNQPEHYVVTEFIVGRMLEKGDLVDMNIKTMIMDRLKIIHRMEDQGGICTPYDLSVDAAQAF